MRNAHKILVMKSYRMRPPVRHRYRGVVIFTRHLTNKLNKIIVTVLGAADFLLPLHVKFKNVNSR